MATNPTPQAQPAPQHDDFLDVLMDLIAQRRGDRSLDAFSAWTDLIGVSSPKESDTTELVLLQFGRSDAASMSRFGQHVENASYCLYLAFDKANVQDFEPSPSRNVIAHADGIHAWYSTLVNSTFHRYRELRKALLHPWTPPAEVEPLTRLAFRLLSEITPADSQLRQLYKHDRSRALQELARQLDGVADQLKATVRLAADLETLDTQDEDGPSPDDPARLAAVQNEILSKAGEPLSLTAAAERLGMTRQGLHKHIVSGTALGLMRGSELVVPGAQFVTQNDRTKIVKGLKNVVALFDSSGAGRWSALQFLVEPDPNLSGAPFEALKQGRIAETENAAKAYLNLDGE